MTDYLEQLWQLAGQEEWEERPVLDWLGGESGLPISGGRATAGETESGGKAAAGRKAAAIPRPSAPLSLEQAAAGSSTAVEAEMTAERDGGSAARTGLFEPGEGEENMCSSPALLEQLSALERRSVSALAIQPEKERGGLELNGGEQRSAADVWNWEQERWDARALDRAFQRDSRRYDGGFFLY